MEMIKMVRATVIIFSGLGDGFFRRHITCCLTHVPFGQLIKHTVDFIHVHTLGNRLKIHSPFKLITHQSHNLLVLQDQEKNKLASFSVCPLRVLKW